jgi:hypothetical protein
MLLQTLLRRPRRFCVTSSIVPQTSVAKPKAVLLIDPRGINRVAVFLQKAIETAIFDTPLTWRKPAEPDPLAHFLWRHVKYLSEIPLRVPVPDPCAFLIPPEHLIHCLWRPPQVSCHLDDRKLSGMLKDVILLLRSPSAMPIRQF